MKTIPEISQLLQRLDHILPTEFIPSITGSIALSKLEIKILSFQHNLGARNTNIFRVIRKRMQQF